MRMWQCIEAMQEQQRHWFLNITRAPPPPNTFDRHQQAIREAGEEIKVRKDMSGNFATWQMLEKNSFSFVCGDCKLFTCRIFAYASCRLQ